MTSRENQEYPAILIKQAWSIKDLFYSFIFKLKLQQQNKTEHETVLLGKESFIAGRYKIYFQCIFAIGLHVIMEKEESLNYLRALTL